MFVPVVAFSSARSSCFIQKFDVMLIDCRTKIWHAAVTSLNGVPDEDFVKLMVLGEIIID